MIASDRNHTPDTYRHSNTSQRTALTALVPVTANHAVCTGSLSGHLEGDEVVKVHLGHLAQALLRQEQRPVAAPLSVGSFAVHIQIQRRVINHPRKVHKYHHIKLHQEEYPRPHPACPCMASALPWVGGCWLVRKLNIG